MRWRTLEKDWTAYPVLHIDLTGSRYTSVSDLEESGFLNSLSQLYAPALIQGEFSVYQFICDIERAEADRGERLRQAVPSKRKVDRGTRHQLLVSDTHNQRLASETVRIKEVATAIAMATPTFV